MSRQDGLEELEKRVRQIPVRSVPPQSERPDIHVDLGGVDFRVRKSQIPGWAWTPIAALVAAVVSGVVTYYHALEKAGARVAALEERDRIHSEEIARLKVNSSNLENGLNHEASINRSQEKRLDGLGAGLVVKDGK